MESDKYKNLPLKKKTMMLVKRIQEIREEYRYVEKLLRKEH